MKVSTSLFSSIRGIIDRLFASAFPHSCAGCGAKDVLFCASCEKTHKPLSPSCFICNKRSLNASICPSCKKFTDFSKFYAPFSYSNPATREIIHRLKYRSMRQYGEIAGNLLAQAAAYYKIAFPKSSIIVPLPLHRSRLLERGYNQSELLAKTCAEKLNIPLAPADSLIRIKNTKPQVGMKDTEARILNIKDAFRVSDATPIFKKHVILIDDVATTGETLNQASRALKRAGASSVFAITLAK